MNPTSQTVLAALRRPATVLLLAVALLLTSAPLPAAQAGGGQGAKVVRWKDGDTVVTNRGTVRLIGVDTPEKGKCGSKTSTKIARRLAPAGTRIRLVNPSAVVGKDKYDRLLRFVQVGRVDVGLRQIKRGSKARYDGIDGYDKHPRQAKYRRADRNNADHCQRKGSGGGGGGGGDTSSYPPVAGTWNCPKNAPIKGNRGDTEWIYHMPGQEYYSKTNPEECFATEEGARKAGYRKAKI